MKKKAWSPRELSCLLDGTDKINVRTESNLVDACINLEQNIVPVGCFWEFDHYSTQEQNGPSLLTHTSPTSGVYNPTKQSVSKNSIQ